MNRFGLTLGSAAAAVLAFATMVSAAEVKKSPEVAETGKLTIANTLEYAPFEFTSEDGKAVGINIELAEETAKLVGAELDILRIPFPSMIPGLSAGKFKVAWETFSATEDRLKSVDFVMFIKSGIVASTTPDKAANFQSENNLYPRQVISFVITLIFLPKIIKFKRALKNSPRRSSF